MTAMEANGLAAAPVILAGSEEQKKEYLGRLTEAPLHGRLLRHRAGRRLRCRRPLDDGRQEGRRLGYQRQQDVDHQRRRGELVLCAREDGPDQGRRLGLHRLRPRRRHPGHHRRRKEINLGQRCSDTRAITFEDVVVPDKNRLGAEGVGFKVAMGAFDHTRPPVASGAVGLARRAMDEAIQYATERKTMGVPIAAPPVAVRS